MEQIKRHQWGELKSLLNKIILANEIKITLYKYFKDIKKQVKALKIDEVQNIDEYKNFIETKRSETMHLELFKEEENTDFTVRIKTVHEDQSYYSNLIPIALYEKIIAF